MDGIHGQLMHDPMSKIENKPNQSLERTPLGPPVLHGFTVHGVAQFGRSEKNYVL